MADTPERAQAARSYLDMLGIRPRRRRAPVDVEIGPAVVEPDDEALAALADAERQAQGVRNVTAALPEGLSEPFAAATSDPDSYVGRALRAVVNTEIVPRGPGYETVMRHLPDAVSSRVRAIPRSIGDAADDRTLEAAETFGERGLDAIPLGFGEELYAASRPDYTTPRQQPQRGPGLGAEDLGAFESDQDRYRRERAARTARNPVSSAAGTVAGSAPAALLTPGATSGSAAGRILQAGRNNALVGAVQGLGLSEEEDTGEQVEDAVVGGLYGGAFGMGGQVLGEGTRVARDAWRMRPWTVPDSVPARGGDFTPQQRAQAAQRLDAGDTEAFDAMTARDAIENEAAMRRVRSTADSAALADVRRAGDYHGPGGEGYRGLARDLDATGISPRGSLTNSRTAQQRASRVGNQAGREIGGVRSEMMARLRPDDMSGPPTVIDDLDPMPPQSTVEDDLVGVMETPPEVGTSGARAGRQRPRGASVLPDDTIPGEPPVMDPVPRDPSRPIDFVDRSPMTPEDIERAGLEVRAAVNQRADPARVRYSGDVMRQDGPYRVELTPANTTARLREEAAEAMRVATTPEQRAAAQELTSLADDIERLPAEDFNTAQGRLDALDREAAYGRMYPNAPDAPGRVERARRVRGGVRADMDEAVRNTLGEDALRRYQAARGRSGAAQATQRLTAAGAEREAANLQLGLTDSMGVHAGLNRQPDANLATRTANAIEGVIVNRYLRGNLHTTVAAIKELQSDAMARQIVRGLEASPSTEAAARMLRSAMERGPRAFGVTLMTLSRESPDVQATTAETVNAFNPDGSPNWNVVPGVRFAPEDPDAPIEEDETPPLDWSLVPGVRFAPEDEEEQR